MSARTWLVALVILGGCTAQSEESRDNAAAERDPAAAAETAADSAVEPAPEAAGSPDAPEPDAASGEPAATEADAPNAPDSADAAEVPEPWDFTLEHAERWESTPGVLATTSYPPSEAEKPFFESVAPQGGVWGHAPLLTVEKEVGKSSTWIGIIRGYRIDEERDQTRLLVETKYFDGLTDTHILCVSFNGGGDVVVVMPGTGHPLSGLSLLRVYGKVVGAKDGVPRIQAEFIREFPLGQYCFMNTVGDDESNPRWRELCKVDLSGEDPDIYDPGPDLQYYVDLLGHPRDFVDGTIEVEVPLD